MAFLDALDPAAWNHQHARHLLNRAGFGVPFERIEHLAGLGPEAAVAYLVAYHAHPQDLDAPDFLLDPIENREIRKMKEGFSEDEIRKAVNERRAAERRATEHLKSWWLDRMRTTNRPLEEKLTLFWHGHFATSAQKVQQSSFNYQLNAVFREHAAGNFKDLAIAVGQSPAMLVYLDNRRSTKNKPNENWGRELMELFTLGQGNYTEDDIKNAARAFTGWTNRKLEFQLALRNHDNGPKAFMGRTGGFDGWDIFKIIFEQPAAATFISRKLWEYFAYENPEPEIVEGLAQTLRANNYELKPLLTQLFLSRAFYSEKALGTQVKSPAQLLVQLCEDLDVPRVPPAFAGRAGRSLGQDLFYPPNVKGWEGNRAWVNANTLLLRYNMPVALVGASLALQQKRSKMAEAVDPEMAGDGETMRDGGAMMPDDSAMMTGEEATPMMSREEYQEQTRQALKQKMAGLAPEERKQEMERFRKGDREARAAILEKYGVAPPPWTEGDPARIFTEKPFKTAGECLDVLCRRFLVTPVQASQRGTLLAALGAAGESAPLTAADIDFAKRRAVVHLITSMAEYQLC
ncbi:MAG: DUF1800 domain-containing protein [Candidatus Hydrogenedentes bacterium]|nr:DUF1800 domain-containing protein [Candidatus Hydrogenedentota bacterium]